eukprot:snap_masked-scaffold_70-processed-gene-0.75-mRNA-1 protein AED:1.00 eAED:1.00 QI:0/0/0/0/1/1/2/0/193
MFEEILLNQEEQSQKQIEAIFNSLAGMNANIEVLDSFPLKRMQKFVRKHEKQIKSTRKYINMKDRLDTDAYSQLDYLGKINFNEEIIQVLKKKTLEIMLQEVGKVELMREKAVEILLKEVNEALGLLPEEAEIKPKKTAETILDLLPSHIWVKKDDLNMKPCLMEVNHVELKSYVLKSIPPKHIRKELKEFYA